MSSFTPTWRELFLLSALLVSLFCLVPQSDFLSSQSPPVHGLQLNAVEFEEDKVPEIDLATVLKYPEPQVTWEPDAVPETKILHHVLGEWSDMLLSDDYV